MPDPPKKGANNTSSNASKPSKASIKSVKSGDSTYSNAPTFRSSNLDDMSDDSGHSTTDGSSESSDYMSMSYGDSEDELPDDEHAFASDSQSNSGSQSNSDDDDDEKLSKATSSNKSTVEPLSGNALPNKAGRKGNNTPPDSPPESDTDYSVPPRTKHSPDSKGSSAFNSGAPSMATTSKVSTKSFTPPDSPEDSYDSDEPSDDSYSQSSSSSSYTHSGTKSVGGTVTSDITGPSAGYLSSKGGQKSAGDASTSNYGDDSSVDTDDDLPPPPPHLIAKGNKAAAFGKDLDAGFSKVCTTLTSAAEAGATSLAVSSQGFKANMTIEVGEGKNKEIFVLQGLGGKNVLLINRPSQIAFPAGTLVKGGFGHSLDEPGTPDSEHDALTADTPLFPPEEPMTPSSYHYSGYPSPPGSISGFSQRSQKANLDGLYKAYYNDRPGDVSPHPGGSITSSDSLTNYVPGGKNRGATRIINAVKEGYQPIKAKFESIGGQEFPDDPYEDMFYKYTPPYLSLIVESAPMDPIPIQIDGGRTYVFENSEDPTHCFMQANPIGAPETTLSFRATNEKAMITFLDEMPGTVFEYPESEDEEEVDSSPSHEEKRPADAKFTGGGRDTSGFGNVLQQHKDVMKRRRKNEKNKLAEEQSVFPVGEVPFGIPPGPPPDEEETFLPPAAADFETAVYADRPPPAPRTELVATRIRKSMPSVRRVRLLCRWLDVLRFWPTKMEISSLHKEFCTGMLLIELMKKLIPSTQFVNVNKNALAKHSACQNLNQAITVIFQSKTFNAARIPTPDDIFNGNVSKITTLIDEIFNVYVRGPLYHLPSFKMLQWYNALLKPYQLGLPREILEEGDVSTNSQLWKHFHSGVALFCIIFHFHGTAKIPVCSRHNNRSQNGEIASIETAEWAAAPPHVRAAVDLEKIGNAIQSFNKEISEKYAQEGIGFEYEDSEYSHSFTYDQLDKIIGEENDLRTWAIVQTLCHFHRLVESTASDGRRHYQTYCSTCACSIRIDPMRVVKNPQGLTDIKANVSYVFSLLQALKVDLLFQVDDWLTFPDIDFVLLQLTYIYETFKNRQGVLPASSGKEAGYTSGPHGEPYIVGMVFADTNPVIRILPAVVRRSKTIVLGAGYHDIPFTPIDSTTKEDAALALHAKMITPAMYEQVARYQTDECPMGLLSDHVTIARTSNASTKFSNVKPQKTTAPWNGQHSVEIDEANPIKHKVISMLKKVHKKTATTADHSITKVFTDDSASTVTDISKMHTKERQSKLDKDNKSRPQPEPMRRYSVTAVNRRDHQHKTVVVDSLEKEAMVRRELLLQHKKHNLAQLADDMKKADDQLEVAEADLVIMLEEIENHHAETVGGDPYYEQRITKHTDAVRAIADDRERVTRFFKMRRTAIEDQFNEFKMKNVTFKEMSGGKSSHKVKTIASSELLLPASKGATHIELVSTRGFRAGQTCDIGSGSWMDKARIIGFTTAAKAGLTRESHRKVAVIDNPLLYDHARGVPVVATETIFGHSSMAASPAAQNTTLDDSMSEISTIGASRGSALPGSVSEKLKKLSNAARGRLAAAKKLGAIKENISRGDESSMDSAWLEPTERQKQEADLMLKQVHLNHSMPQPTPAEMREHVKFQTEAEERRAIKIKVALDKRLPGNGIHMAWAQEFVEHCRKTKTALDKRFPGNSVPLEYVEVFVQSKIHATRRDEKGWNLANTKLHSYNASIRTKTEANKSQLLESWTPASVRAEAARKKQKQVERARKLLGLQVAEVDSLLPSGHGVSSTGSVVSNVSTLSGKSRPIALHTEPPETNDPEAVFRRFKLHLIAQNHIFNLKRQNGTAATASIKPVEDRRNVAQRELDKLRKLGIVVGTQDRDDSWVHLRMGEANMQLVEHVYDDLKHRLAAVDTGAGSLVDQLVRRDDPFGEIEGHLDATAQAMALKIRDDEVMSLLYEDVRGELCLIPGMKKAPVAKAPVMLQAPPLAMVPSHLAEQAAKAKVERELAEEIRIQEENIETAFRYLHEDRALSLADRHLDTSFMFRVEKETRKAPKPGLSSTTDYVLKWYKPGESFKSAPAGFVCLADIKSISEGVPVEKQGSFIVSIDPSNAKALKSCVGRTKLTIKGDAGEIKKYAQRLQVLHNSLR